MTNIPIIISTYEFSRYFFAKGHHLGSICSELYTSVKERTMADVEGCVLISGGLDSAITSSLYMNEMMKKNVSSIHSFTVALKDVESSDLKYAKIMADHLGTTHHEVMYTLEEGIGMIEKAIYHLGTYCTTTIRASIPMMIMMKYIHDNFPSIKYCISGEGADEDWQGYTEFKNAPSEIEAVKHSIHRRDNIHFYDGRRADISSAMYGLEMRFPFASNRVITLSRYISRNYPKEIWPNSDINKGTEKRLLRDAFKDISFAYTSKLLIPDEIRLRKKEAFSDGVGGAWRQALIDYAEKHVDQKLYDMRGILYHHDTPQTKEDFLYRSIFEKFYPNRAKDLLPDGKWMPAFTTVAEHGGDPSATILKKY
jgi:asparagine synthase (glutamine-hydrolysing)